MPGESPVSASDQVGDDDQQSRTVGVRALHVAWYLPDDLTYRPQLGYKKEVLARDVVCLLTELRHEDCVAAYIVPQSLADKNNALPR